MTSPGRLIGVGVGPGDPELMTLRAVRAIAEADVVVWMVAPHGDGVARGIAAGHLREDHEQIALVYPVTTGTADHPEGYEGALRDFYDDAAERLAAHLGAGRTVAVLCEGDPLFYGSYMYLHERLADRFPSEVVAGVTSFSAAAASAGVPLCKRDDVLTILPGTLPPEILAARLRATDAAVVMKLGRTFTGVRDAARQAGIDRRAVYVERASSEAERLAALDDVDAKGVPYMALVLVPTTSRPSIAAPTASRVPVAAATPVPMRGARGGRGDSGGVRRGSVVVVGLGPAGPDWLTPEALAELAAAEVLVGYGPYLDRVPHRPGQRRHASENRVEADRARHALELAADGARVAVVSSGDPGIFAMAAAVLEQAEALNGSGPPDVRIVPGLSAMQAAAARAGAPLGHDFCVISLSDNLKPWEIIERRLHAAGEADLVLALYNPASKTRREQLVRALAVMRKHRAPDTPVIRARAVGSRDETVEITTLGALDPALVDMRTLVIVGSSQTRLVHGSDGAVRVLTPRSYAPA